MLDFRTVSVGLSAFDCAVLCCAVLRHSYEDNLFASTVIVDGRLVPMTVGTELSQHGCLIRGKSYLVDW